MLTVNETVGKGAANKEVDVLNVLTLLQARKNQSALKAAMESIEIPEKNSSDFCQSYLER